MVSFAIANVYLGFAVETNVFLNMKSGTHHAMVCVITSPLPNNLSSVEDIVSQKTRSPSQNGMTILLFAMGSAESMLVEFKRKKLAGKLAMENVSLETVMKESNGFLVPLEMSAFQQRSGAMERKIVRMAQMKQDVLSVQK